MLVFRDQSFGPQQQVDFSRRFGRLQIRVLRQFALDGHPEVLIVSNIRENGQPVGLCDAGHSWHSDLSCKAVPGLGSMLHAPELSTAGACKGSDCAAHHPGAPCWSSKNNQRYGLTKMVQRSNVFERFASPKLSGHPVKAHKPSPE